MQTYQRQKVMWITFSSTRDYGVRLLNHKPGMHQCYPADSLERPGAAPGGGFDASCQQPQLWMAPIVVSQQGAQSDPSRPAFWIPYQDITTHNHTAEWTPAAASPPPPPDAGSCTCSMEGGPCGTANSC